MTAANHGMSTGPNPTDVAELRDLLDLMGNFTSNDQRARYLLTSDWLRNNGARLAEESHAALAELRARAQAGGRS
ncbi:hypothetical protein ACOCHS_06475 [Propionibacteriaceae bacterium Y2011]